MRQALLPDSTLALDSGLWALTFTCHRIACTAGDRKLTSNFSDRGWGFDLLQGRHCLVIQSSELPILGEFLKMKTNHRLLDPSQILGHGGTMLQFGTQDSGEHYAH